jgi:hypothetical protein
MATADSNRTPGRRGMSGILRLLLTPRGGNGGESGIRTHGTLLTYTRFPSVRLKPLGHLSLGDL